MPPAGVVDPVLDQKHALNRTVLNVKAFNVKAFFSSLLEAVVGDFACLLEACLEDFSSWLEAVVEDFASWPGSVIELCFFLKVHAGGLFPRSFWLVQAARSFLQWAGPNPSATKFA